MFSVLIPVYNHRAFLTETVLSALTSPLVREVLLVDDGSTDGSTALFPLVQQFSSKVRVLDGPPGNLGAHTRLNQLADAAESEWLSVLNSDDMFAAGRFEAVERFATSGEHGLIFGDLVVIDGQGNRIGLRSAVRHGEVAWPDSYDLPRLILHNDWLRLMLLQNVVATTTNMIFTRRLHRQIGGFRNLRYCHDWDFALRSVLTGRVLHVPMMLSYYRMHRSNTIKESQERVNAEARGMLYQVMMDFPRLQQDGELRGILAASPRLGSSASPVLAVVIANPISRALLQQDVTAAALAVAVLAADDEQPPGCLYIFRPGDEAAAALRVSDLRATLLALSVRAYDAFLLSRTPVPSPRIGARDIYDTLVLRFGAVGRWRRGSVRLVRLYSYTQPDNALADIGLDEIAVDHADADQVRSEWANSPRQLPPFPLITDDRRPVVLVLPAFLAVGGAERIVIETMRELASGYRFVIATTEPLRVEQGSLHSEAAEFAHIYDLAELVRQEDRLTALAMLQDWYRPAIVWITNGTPWQIAQAAAIRNIFSDIPIVDHQAYDHNVGWIVHFKEAGVAAADRFVAINRKIMNSMSDHYGIDAEKIDLIYHGAKVSHLHRGGCQAAKVRETRRHFGLDPDRPVFGMLGRLTPQKRPLDLCALAKRIGPDIQFTWTGLGELAESFVNAAAVLPNVVLVPAQTDVRPIYEMLDGLIITSKFEGLPVVLLEALSMGVPALSTDVGAIREVLERYSAGMVFSPPGDMVALERAFRTFVHNLEKFKAAAIDARDRVKEEFSSARMARDYDACFRRAISGRITGTVRSL